MDFITPLIRRECFDKVGMMDENVPAYQEWDTFLRISRHYDFDFVPETLAVYHIHKGDAISKNMSRAAKAYSYIVEKHKDEILCTFSKRTLSIHYSILSGYYFVARCRRIWSHRGGSS